MQTHNVEATPIPAKIRVTAEKCIKASRQTITPMTQEEVPAIVGKLLPLVRAQRVNGSIAINLSQGGVRNLVVENIEEVDKK